MKGAVKIESKTISVWLLITVMVLDKLLYDVRKAGGVARTASLRVIEDSPVRTTSSNQLSPLFLEKGFNETLITLRC